MQGFAARDAMIARTERAATVRAVALNTAVVTAVLPLRADPTITRSNVARRYRSWQLPIHDPDSVDAPRQRHATPDMRIGVDLGGTKIDAVVLDDAGTEHVRRRVPTPRGDYDATVAAVAALVRQLEAEVGRGASVGVGMPGIVSPHTGVVKNANSTWLIGRPLDRDLATALGRDVRCANDANCLALSEARDGAAVDARCVFAVILGTGVGGGLTVDGVIVEGASGLTGEWGHNPLPWPAADELPGAACYCGQHGCVETWLSGPAFARDHRDAGGDALDPPGIVAAAEAGSATASASLRRYVDRLARGLAVVVNLLDPDVIVLGGGMSNVAALYQDVPPLLGGRVFGRESTVSLRRAVHGDASGVRGAAWLWP